MKDTSIQNNDMKNINNDCDENVIFKNNKCINICSTFSDTIMYTDKGEKKISSDIHLLLSCISIFLFLLTLSLTKNLKWSAIWILCWFILTIFNGFYYYDNQTFVSMVLGAFLMVFFICIVQTVILLKIHYSKQEKKE